MKTLERHTFSWIGFFASSPYSQDPPCPQFHCWKQHRKPQRMELRMVKWKEVRDGAEDGEEDNHQSCAKGRHFPGKGEGGWGGSRMGSTVLNWGWKRERLKYFLGWKKWCLRKGGRLEMWIQLKKDGTGNLGPPNHPMWWSFKAHLIYKRSLHESHTKSSRPGKCYPRTTIYTYNIFFSFIHTTIFTLNSPVFSVIFPKKVPTLPVCPLSLCLSHSRPFGK